MAKVKTVFEGIGDVLAADARTAKSKQLMLDATAQKFASCAMALLKTPGNSEAKIAALKAEVQEFRKTDQVEHAVLPKSVHDKLLKAVQGR
jgi:hypothetical protein